MNRFKVGDKLHFNYAGKTPYLIGHVKEVLKDSYRMAWVRPNGKPDTTAIYPFDWFEQYDIKVVNGFKHKYKEFKEYQDSVTAISQTEGVKTNA